MLSAKKPKILLVDDEAFLLEMYGAKFEKSGYDVKIATSADEGILTIQNGFKPDILLIDINMPIKSGYEFMDMLRTLHLPRSCIKIALSNEGSEGAQKRMLELGAVTHLVKAKYTPSELVTAVEDIRKKNSGWLSVFTR